MAGPRTGAGRSATPAAFRHRRATPFLVALVPLALALVAVPGRTVPANLCPPGGEGYVACQLYKVWAPYVTSIALVWLGLYVAGQLVFLALPHAVRRYRSGERLRQAPRLPAVLHHADPALAAATWGQSATATPSTRVMGGFGWAQASSRAGRVMATPELLLAAAAERPVLAPVRPVPEPLPLPRPRLVPPVREPVVLPGAVALGVCRTCESIVEGDPAAEAVPCGTCATVFHRRPRITTAVAPSQPPSPGATRVVLLAAGLDPSGLARLEEAIVRRPGEARRVVVLQLPPRERLRPGAFEALQLAGRAAHDAEGEIVIVTADAHLRDRLAGLDLPRAATTGRAMEIASAHAPVRPPVRGVPEVGDRSALA